MSKDMGKVSKIVDRNGSALSWTMADLIEYHDTLDKNEYPKGMCLFLDDRGCYDIDYTIAGLKHSECLALLDVIRADMINRMLDE